MLQEQQHLEKHQKMTQQPKTEEIGLEPAKPNFLADDNSFNGENQQTQQRVVLPRERIKMTL